MSEAKMNNTGIWTFRILVLAGTGLLLASWFLPWWTVNIEALGKDIVQIRPWGLAMDERLGGFEVLLKGADMPVWFAPFMWAYLGLSVIALLASLWVRGVEVNIGKFKVELCQLLVGGVGVSYLVVGIVTAVYGSIRSQAMMGIPLLGRHFIDMGDPLVTYVEGRFLPGYYLIFVAAIMLIALALLRNRICSVET
ncbi:MAG: hypothetical protein ACLFPU_09535 [Dehalococcoidia bacterium]